MRKINYMGWAVAALLIVSCQGGTNIPGTDISPGIVDTPTVKWDAGVNTNPVLDATGGSLSVSFTSSDAWKASIINGRADWLRLSPESGNKGKGTLTIQVSPNEEYDERRATVQVKCGTAQVTLLVTQKQKDAFTASASKQEFGFDISLSLFCFRIFFEIIQMKLILSNSLGNSLCLGRRSLLNYRGFLCKFYIYIAKFEDDIIFFHLFALQSFVGYYCYKTFICKL